MKQVLIGVIALLCSLPMVSWANTRLGLHVTQDELNVWKTRRTDNVNGSNGVTYASIYTNRILNKANAFKNNTTHPNASADGRWAPTLNNSTCYPSAQQDNYPGRQLGLNLMASAFHYMITGDASYGNPVLSELLAQIQVVNTDFSNPAKWCVVNNDGNSIEIPGWPTRLLFAYDYLRIGQNQWGNLSPAMTTANRQDLETWFNNAAVYWLARVDLQISSNVFPNRLSDNYTCSGNCPGSCGFGILYFGGPTVECFHNSWSNRLANSVTLVGAVANMMTPINPVNSNLGPRAKRYFEEAIKYSTFPDGTNQDFFRWNSDGGCTDGGIGSSWTHGEWAHGPLQSVADHFARAGDMSLYNYTSNVGLFGTGGTTKGLRVANQRVAAMVNGTVTVYATTQSSNQIPACRILPTAEGGHTEDWGAMINNIYYQDSGIHTAMERGMTPTSSCGGTNCFGGAYGVYLDIPFQWSNLDSGQVDPFTLTTPTATLVGFWPLNETAGTTVANITTPGSPGTVRNGTTTCTINTAGCAVGAGGQLTFDGAASPNNDNVVITRTTALEPTAVSVCADVTRIGTPANYADVVNKTWQNDNGPTFASYGFQLNPGGVNPGRISFMTGFLASNDELNSPDNILPDNISMSVCGTYDPTAAAPQKKLYVNGMVCSLCQATLTSPLVYETSASGNLYIATNGNNRAANIRVKNVRVYNGALTPQEVLALNTSTLSGFTDNFNTAGRDTTLWTQGALLFSTTDTGVVIDETTAPQLQITPRNNLAAPASAYNGYTTLNAYNLMGGGSVGVEVVQTVNTATGRTETILQVGSDTSNVLLMQEEGGLLNCKATQGGVSSQQDLSYVNATHRWWRIRQEPVGDLIKLETATQSAPTVWNTCLSVARTMDLTAVKAELASGTWDSVASPGSTIVDNFALTVVATDSTPPPAPANLRVMNP